MLNARILVFTHVLGIKIPLLEISSTLLSTHNVLFRVQMQSNYVIALSHENILSPISVVYLLRITFTYICT